MRNLHSIMIRWCTRTKVSSEVQTIKAGKALKLHLQPSGGAALRFVLVK